MPTLNEGLISVRIVAHTHLSPILQLFFIKLQVVKMWAFHPLWDSTSWLITSSPHLLTQGLSKERSLVNIARLDLTRFERAFHSLQKRTIAFIVTSPKAGTV